jgi:serine protease Do
MLKNVFTSILLAVLVSGCASSLAPTTQDVEFLTDRSDTKVYVDEEYVGTGDKVEANLTKDLKTHTVRFEIDSCRYSQVCFLQNTRSNYYYFSLFPFGALLLIPPMVDNGDNAWKFYESYNFSHNFIRYSYWDNTKKNIDIARLSLNITDTSFTTLKLRYDEYHEMSNLSEYSKVIEPDFKLISQYYDTYHHVRRLKEHLKKLNYLDTTKSVLGKGINDTYLSCEIISCMRYEVNRLFYNEFSNTFNRLDLKTRWHLRSIYGDSLLVKEINCSSEEFVFEDMATTSNKLLEDALNKSLCLLQNDNEFQKAIEIEKYNRPSNAIQIEKPNRNPSIFDEAVLAVVTIKHDDGLGSGFLISHDGYIITNYHVISRSDDISVITNDKEELEAEIVRYNKFSDIALLKVNKQFPYAFQVPETDKFEVADDVIAIGTPKNIELGQSVSKGIISGYREKENNRVIQTDLSINSGNSGGAIVNSNAELIGIVEYKMIGLCTEGISFAIPASLIFETLKISY